MSSLRDLMHAVDKLEKAGEVLREVDSRENATDEERQEAMNRLLKAQEYYEYICGR